jgi:hypothetical protein
MFRIFVKNIQNYGDIQTQEKRWRRLGAAQQRVRFPASIRDLIFFENHAASYSVSLGTSFPEVKRPEREADN